MRWRKLGLVWGPGGTQPWARSHAMLPTPVARDDCTIRVFVTTLDDAGRGRPFYVDVAGDDPTRVIGTATAPLLELGRPGCFDDAGVVPCSVVDEGGGRLRMYYVGFELCRTVRYRMFTGVACSDDGGASFKRHSRAPVLDRSDAELMFRCGPHCTRSADGYRMLYIAGSDWTEVGGKQLPVYDLRLIESPDGVTWPTEGRRLLRVSDPDEHGFGRPWVLPPSAGVHRMVYSVRSRSRQAYRLGYAESTDGLIWTRRDSAIGLDVTPGSFDSEAIMYMATVTTHGGTYAFYNGNGFGRDGFAAAVLETE